MGGITLDTSSFVVVVGGTTLDTTLFVVVVVVGSTTLDTTRLLRFLFFFLFVRTVLRCVPLVLLLSFVSSVLLRFLLSF